MKRFWFGSFLISILLFGIYVFYQSYAFSFFVKDQQLIKLSLKKNFFAPVQKEIVVEVAKSQASVAKGLSNRAEMHSLTGQKIDGLLFIFPKKEIRHFWMKEMLFQLDICWLDNLVFISCQRMAEFPQDDQEPKSYFSPQPSNLVLETQPGFFSDEALQSKLFFQWW